MYNIMKYLVMCGSYAVVVVFLTPHYVNVGYSVGEVL